MTNPMAEGYIYIKGKRGSEDGCQRLLTALYHIFYSLSICFGYFVKYNNRRMEGMCYMPMKAAVYAVHEYRCRQEN